jgi:hypothetical protein
MSTSLKFEIQMENSTTQPPPVGSSTNEIPNKKLVCEDLQTWLYKNHTAFAMSGQVIIKWH